MVLSVEGAIVQIGHVNPRINSSSAVKELGKELIMQKKLKIIGGNFSCQVLKEERISVSFILSQLGNAIQRRTQT